MTASYPTTIRTAAMSAVMAGVKDINAGLTIVLSFPLVNAPAAGDTFTIYQGCDHTWTTCNAPFGNLANFRGYPFIPPPQTQAAPPPETNGHVE